MAQGNNSLNQRAENQVHTAEVVRHGEKLIVPEKMPIPSAIEVLAQVLEDEETLIEISEPIDCFPWEGAIAFRQAIEELFGYSRTVATMGFFGPNPPKEISIETGLNTKTTAPWGQFHFALADTSDQWIGTGSTGKDGRLIFSITAIVKKKFRSTIMQLADRTRQIVLSQSIYRGKALRIAFTADNGQPEPIPTPRFIQTNPSALSSMVYSRDLEQLMEVNVLAPLRHAAACRQAGIPLKRGILLAGPYGTGKSLFAAAVAQVATDHDWTYIYIKDASELSHAIKFAKSYQPAVIFAEDVDRHVTGERTDAMDKILNTLDGIDSKGDEIMVVLTTNHLDQVNRAMLRPGRLDVILNVIPPDAEAVQRLVRLYGRTFVSTDTDLGEVGTILAGQTPAVIREAVERSKLAGIARTGEAFSLINAEDLAVAARTLMQQQSLLIEKPATPTTWADDMVHAFASRAVDTLKSNGLGEMEDRIEALHEHILE